ncbi:hypothetical protein PEPS_37900 (plasmid) [Persicobacter psychrovividus]|uniref:Lipid/polyisoprenoid-binding YceI-like domain-containing protein n=2 Tax=Persicobacter psychrovividus TaxID=387638 RepID=A0ABM7VKK8_9BACT|nr:hypothetical protein PEPS_37900 [Persicobacter psychrovividus]
MQQHACAQKIRATQMVISFYSKAPLEDIDATNNQGVSAIDMATSKIAFVVPIIGFEFKNGLMQEHFNENYLESDQYPKATYAGDLIHFDPEKKGVQKVSTKGVLTIHGQSQSIEAKGTMERKGSEWHLICQFSVKLEDYDIEVPKLMFQKIAETISIDLQATYPLQ